MVGFLHDYSEHVQNSHVGSRRLHDYSEHVQNSRVGSRPDREVK